MYTTEFDMSHEPVTITPIRLVLWNSTSKGDRYIEFSFY